MFTVGQQVAAGYFPLWLATQAFDQIKGPALVAAAALAVAALSSGERGAVRMPIRRPGRRPPARSALPPPCLPTPSPYWPT
jgi:hypothetical protein